MYILNFATFICTLSAQMLWTTISFLRLNNSPGLSNENEIPFIRKVIQITDVEKRLQKRVFSSLLSRHSLITVITIRIGTTIKKKVDSDICLPFGRHGSVLAYARCFVEWCNSIKTYQYYSKTYRTRTRFIIAEK